jgi:5-methylthioribose kinase
LTATVDADVAAALLAHLFRRGLIASPAGYRVAALSGGVSNDVFTVFGDGFDVVVKKALGQLKVADHWSADRVRLQTEGGALMHIAELTPDAVPRVIDLSDEFLVIERAPRSWIDWKRELLFGEADPAVGFELGALLSAWQTSTYRDSAVAAQFGSRVVFHQLRVEPFYQTVAERRPDLASHIEEVVALMLERALCLVHGDYTPKNILVGPKGVDRRLWCLDWEVAHFGDPDFDPGLLIAHLIIKSIHTPAARTGLRQTARRFMDGLVGSPAGLDTEHLARQVACMLLARVYGKSPLAYLSNDERQEVSALGAALLARPPATLDEIWEMEP